MKSAYEPSGSKSKFFLILADESSFHCFECSLTDFSFEESRETEAARKTEKKGGERKLYM